MAVINGKNKVLGRLASNVAERLLKGEQIDIVNCEQIVISGKKTMVVQKFQKKIDLRRKGNPEKGPKFPKNSDALVKRSIRGMIPRTTARGREALKKLKCYIGVPKKFSNSKLEEVKVAENKLTSAVTEVKELSKMLGGKW